MIDYDTTTSDNITTLFYTTKKGNIKEICKVAKTSKDRLLIVQSDILNMFRFKDNQEPVIWVKRNDILVSVISDRLQVFKKPSAQSYHFEILRNNRTASFLNANANDTNKIVLDYDGILDNMLEFIKEL